VTPGVKGTFGVNGGPLKFQVTRGVYGGPLGLG
jgi:hypothetical protein